MAEEITYSIDDIIQGELELEQDVNVILGAASDQNVATIKGTCIDNSHVYFVAPVAR